MGIDKQITIDRIEVLESGAVQVRTATRIYEDSVLLSETFSRHVVLPGDDFSKEESRVQSICSAVHTPECIAAYSASIAQGV